MNRHPRSIVIALLLALYGASTSEAQTFDLTFNGKKIPIEVGKEYSESVEGKNVSFKLARREVSVYNDEYVSFPLPGNLEVAKKKLSDNLWQLMFSSATGNFVLVQEYGEHDPSDLVDIMVKAVTKSDVAEGYTLDKKPNEKKLKNGKILKGVNVHATHGKSAVDYTFHYISGDSEGIFIITRLTNEDTSSDSKMFDLFWSGVEPKFGEGGQGKTAK